MPLKRTSPDPDKLDPVVAETRRILEQRNQGYREQALKLYPWICARCGREFTPKNLRELTVHHKDHNHDNNPPDGRNWELLCLYCHDDEHGRYWNEGGTDEATPIGEKKQPATYKPFADLSSLLKDKE